MVTQSSRLYGAIRFTNLIFLDLPELYSQIIYAIEAGLIGDLLEFCLLTLCMRVIQKHLRVVQLDGTLKPRGWCSRP